MHLWSFVHTLLCIRIRYFYLFFQNFFLNRYLKLYWWCFYVSQICDLFEPWLELNSFKSKIQENGNKCYIVQLEEVLMYFHLQHHIMLAEIFQNFYNMLHYIGYIKSLANRCKMWALHPYVSFSNSSLL